jgi:DNA-binding NarL/FixJ family response regulator
LTQPADSPVAVVIIHQSPVLRAGLAELLGRQPDIQLRGDFACGADLLEDPVPDEHVLLFDLGAAHRDGVQRLKGIRERMPQARVLMFNVSNDDRAIIECVQVGASGCVLEDASLEEIVSAIHSLARGTPPASPRVITSLFKYVATLSTGEEPT